MQVPTSFSLRSFFRKLFEMRQTRSQSRLLAAQCKDGTTQQARSSYQHLFILVNDFTDPDNLGAASVWVQMLELNPHVKAIFICEPRQVRLGLPMMSGKQIARCLELLQEKRGITKLEATQIWVGGRLKQSELDAMEGLSEDDRIVLQLCVQPADGPKDDALLHAQLVAQDYLSAIKSFSKQEFEVYMDEDSLDRDTSPINMHIHHHEDLVARSKAELDEYQSLMQSAPLPDDRLDALRRWYVRCLDRLTPGFEKQRKYPVAPVDLSYLAQQIKIYERVTLFGGASLDLMWRLLESDRALGQNIDCYQQGGTYDRKLTLLGTPLNFSLNTAAANYVSDNAKRLRSYTLLTTDTTKKVTYTLSGIRKYSPNIAYRSMAYSTRTEPWEIIHAREHEVEDPSSKDFLDWRSEAIEDPKYAEKCKPPVVLADLTAFLLVFTNAFEKWAKSTEDRVVDDDWLLTSDPKSTLKSLNFEPGALPDGLVIDDLKVLVKGGLSNLRLPT